MTFYDAAFAIGVEVGVLKRLQRKDLLSSAAERRDRGEYQEMSVAEIIRAAAFRHFQDGVARPDARTRGWLLRQPLHLRPFLIVMRATKSVIVIDVDSLLAVVSEPGVYAVYDPSPLLRRLRVDWVGNGPA